MNVKLLTSRADPDMHRRRPVGRARLHYRELMNMLDKHCGFAAKGIGLSARPLAEQSQGRVALVQPLEEGPSPRLPFPKKNTFAARSGSVQEN